MSVTMDEFGEFNEADIREQIDHLLRGETDTIVLGRVRGQADIDQVMEITNSILGRHFAGDVLTARERLEQFVETWVPQHPAIMHREGNVLHVVFGT